MRKFKLRKKEIKKQPISVEKIIAAGLSSTLSDNIKKFKRLFTNNDTLIYRMIENRNHPNAKFCLLFFDGMVDSKLVNSNIIKPISLFSLPEKVQDILEFISTKVVQVNELKKCEDMNHILESVFSGDSVLLVDGLNSALILNTKGWQSRSIAESDNEKTISGPKEGFTESIIVDLSMIRRRLKTHDLKFTFRTFGVRTKTKACICYIEGITSAKILQELNSRLDSVDLDGVLDSEYLREFIRDARYSPFSTVGTTERPDIICAKLLEGRIAIVLDGSPVVLTLPFLFLENLQTGEDYYLNYYIASFNRMMRILALLITSCIPAIYLSLITFHQELIPTPLLLSISAARQSVPFPSIVELLGLLLAFEVLRETGTRMPSNIGQALSIVGALVLGQAAVDAKLVSAPIVIIVGISGITNLMLPKMASSLLVMRLTLVLISAFIGLYGFIFLVSVYLIHLFGLRSFGVPFMSHIGSLKLEDIKDTALRVPWWQMNLRPRFITADRKRKTKKDGQA